ncbi:MAG: hypothetical protein ABI592_14150 [Acidobacteriota bacterium]
MNARNVRFGLLTAAALFASTLAAAAPGPEVSRNHFDSDAPMREPGFFDFVVLGAPGEALWKVVTEFNPPSAPNGVSQVLAERPSESIATALRRNVVARDGTFSLGIKRTAGRGGIVLRWVDAKNFLALLVDPLTGEAHLTSYRQGRATELARGKGESDRVWGALVITAAGPNVSATWEGKLLLDGTDPAPASGRAGIATAGPGILAFDEFLIQPAS